MNSFCYLPDQEFAFFLLLLMMERKGLGRSVSPVAVQNI
jgi:hypothetical protein